MSISKFFTNTLGLFGQQARSSMLTGQLKGIKITHLNKGGSLFSSQATSKLSERFLKFQQQPPLKTSYCSLDGLNKESSKQKTVAITGGTGRVAKQVIKDLVDEGMRIVYITRRELEGKDTIIADFSKHITEGEVSGISRSLDHYGVDSVLHLATYSGECAREAHQVNVEGTRAIVKALEGSDSKPYLLSASSTASMIIQEAENEDYNLEGQAYAKTKAHADTIVSEYENSTTLVLDVMLDPAELAERIDLRWMGVPNLFKVIIGESSSRVAPIHMKEGAKVISSIVSKSIDREEIPRKVHVGGDEMTCRSWCDLLNPNPLVTVKFDPKFLKGLSYIVNNGAFSPDFLDLAQLPESILERATLDTAYARSILSERGMELTSVESLASQVRETVSVGGVTTLAKNVWNEMSISDRFKVFPGIVSACIGSKVWIGREEEDPFPLTEDSNYDHEKKSGRPPGVHR